MIINKLTIKFDMSGAEVRRVISDDKLVRNVITDTLFAKPGY